MLTYFRELEWCPSIIRPTELITWILFVPVPSLVSVDELQWPRIQYELVAIHSSDCSEIKYAHSNIQTTQTYTMLHSAITGSWMSPPEILKITSLSNIYILSFNKLNIWIRRVRYIPDYRTQWQILINCLMVDKIFNVYNLHNLYCFQQRYYSHVHA